MPNNKIQLICLMLLAMLLGLARPSAAQILGQEMYFDEASSPETGKEIYDPYEKWNRKVFSFNDKVYRYALSPLAKGYTFVVPKRIQKHIHNFFTNIYMPKRFFNCLFQKKFKGSAIAFNRFLINSTIGVGGFFDPATHVLDLEFQDEDFGQTLGFYGMNEGAYVVLPLLGPSTKRDMVGMVGNMALNPLFWAGILEWDPEEAFLAARIESGVNTYTYKVHDGYANLQDNSIEPYVSLRDIYIKHRRNKVLK